MPIKLHKMLMDSFVEFFRFHRPFENALNGSWRRKNDTNKGINFSFLLKYFSSIVGKTWCSGGSVA